MINHLPKKEYDKLLLACDVGLVFLDHRFTIPNFSSRILSNMENSMPVLAATYVNTEIGKVITENKFGFLCENNDEDAFKSLVDKICRNTDNISSLGENARIYLENNYVTSLGYEIITNHFNKT